jgi:hypothetical protein
MQSLIIIKSGSLNWNHMSLFVYLTKIIKVYCTSLTLIVLGSSNDKDSLKTRINESINNLIISVIDLF